MKNILIISDPEETPKTIEMMILINQLMNVKLVTAISKIHMISIVRFRHWKVLLLINGMTNTND